MFIIIHGSHRHGHCWEKATALAYHLKALGIKDVEIIDLSASHIDFCCGMQICQDDECIFKHDEFSTIHKPKLLKADGIYMVTPTYFNMPPAMLKNFIDRTNALLPLIDSSENHTIFGAYVCGEADINSIGTNLSLLQEYAGIMGWKDVEKIDIADCISEETETICMAMEEVAKIIESELMAEGVCRDD